jgi:GNAT superfamily N-acetyltransferase
LKFAMHHAAEVRAIDAAQIDAGVAGEINRLMLDAWPHLAQQWEGTIEFLLRRWSTYDGPRQEQPLYHLIYQAGELVALAHTFGRTIGSSEGMLTVMGLANVCVEKGLQGQGFGRQAAEAALARVDRGDFPASLFQTSLLVEPFYAQLGAARATNRFFNSLADDPTANPFWEPVVMRYPATAPWPAGDVDLRGPGY